MVYSLILDYKNKIVHLLMKEINEKELEFVAKHYKEGALNTEHAWRVFADKVGRRRNAFARIAVAASVTLVVCIAMAGGYWYYGNVQKQESKVVAPATNYRIVRKSPKGIILKYENEPVGNVLAELSSYYGKKVTTDEAGRCISGEIEATSLDEVVEILRITLDIEIDVK